MISLEPGQRVKLVANRQGFWMAHLFGLCYYLDLNDQPTGTVTDIRPGREPAAAMISVAIDHNLPPGLLRPLSWSFFPGMLLPTDVDERRPALVCDGVGQPVAAETVRAALREYVSEAPDEVLLQPRATVLRYLQGLEEKSV